MCVFCKLLTLKERGGVKHTAYVQCVVMGQSQLTRINFFLISVLSFLTGYGWYAVGFIIVGFIAWTQLEPKIKRWLKMREDDQESAEYHKSKLILSLLLIYYSPYFFLITKFFSTVARVTVRNPLSKVSYLSKECIRDFCLFCADIDCVLH